MRGNDYACLIDSIISNMLERSTTEQLKYARLDLYMTVTWTLRRYGRYRDTVAGNNFSRIVIYVRILSEAILSTICLLSGEGLFRHSSASSIPFIHAIADDVHENGIFVKATLDTLIRLF